MYNHIIELLITEHDEATFWLYYAKEKNQENMIINVI